MSTEQITPTITEVTESSTPSTEVKEVIDQTEADPIEAAKVYLKKTKEGTETTSTKTKEESETKKVIEKAIDQQTDEDENKEDEKKESADKEESKEDKEASDKQKEVEEKFATRFASLSRKEKQLREQAKTFKSEKEEFSKKYSKYAEIETLIEKGDKFAAAEKLGLTTEELVENLISKEKQEEEQKTVDFKVKSLEEKIAKLESDLAQKEAAFQKKEIMGQLDNFKRDITDFVTKNSDKYEICATQNLTEDIYETIKATYAETGNVISIEEATAAVEAHYEQEFETKWSKVNKFRSKIAPEPKTEATSPVNPVVEAPKEEKKPVRTITNSDSSSSSSKSMDDMTDEERLEAAKKLLKTTWHKAS